MLKTVILCVLLWYEMCEFSSRAHPCSTDVQIEPKGNYYFNITFNINAPLFEPTASTGASPIASVIASTAYPRQIPPKKGYVVTNGIGAHRLYYKDLTWQKAREICINDGGDLVVITSYLEAKIVREMISDSRLGEAWIGFHNQFVRTDWISVFNETLGENGWMRWHSNFDIDKDSQCAVYSVPVYHPEYSGMIAHSCDSVYRFICKITTI